MSTLHEREDAIIRGILSGNNQCGMLQTAMANRDENYFRQAVRPTLKVYEDEAGFSRIQRDLILQQSEKRRQALEFVAANVALPRHIADAVGIALERPITTL